MTSPSDSTADNQPRPGEPAPLNESASASNESQPAGDSLGQSDAVLSSLPDGAASIDEGLPEWEPLTPELVEDEAIRGDFVLRWAVIGLALLFGFSQIAETKTLVHIKSGQYLASHGVLPSANDVFSSTAGDRRWVNLSWLFDLFAAGVHAVAGGIGLSIAQGVLAGVAFGCLVHAHRSGIRTWWGSICAVMALLVCYPQITMQPELVTLAGLAFTLFVALQSEESSSRKGLWKLVPFVWLWSQFDNRAWFGWLLLMLLAAGESMRSGVLGDEVAANRRRDWWRVAGASLAVTVIHPFLFEAWLAPWRLFMVDYPALRQVFPKPSVLELSYFSILFPAFWDSISHSAIAAMVLFVATLVTLFLNRERLHPGHLLAVLVFNAMACLTTHELAAASLVNCAICTVNAQVWYRQRFGQVYSVDWRELLFSRGGRAVTVFSFFGLAWLVISGRIDGAGGKRTGIGFDQNLAIQMSVFENLAAHSLDDRPFHFALRHGDLVIWSGQKSFVDQRAGLFAGAGDRDLIGLYNTTRRALQQKREQLPGSGEPAVWQAVFDKYQITHVMPRLTGPIPAPDYTTFSDLLSSKDWALTNLASATAVFYRDGTDTPELKDFIDKHRVNHVERAFRTEGSVPETTREWAKPATTYDNMFSLRRPSLPAGVQAGQHRLQMSVSGGEIPLPVRAGLVLTAIRDATAGLRDDPHSAEGYRVLGMSHLILDRIESGIMSEARAPWSPLFRYYQAIAALQQATALRPDDVGVRYDMLALLEKLGRADLALQTLQQIKRLQPYRPDSTEQERQQRESLLDREIALEEGVSKLNEMTRQGLDAGAERLEVANAAAQSGGVLAAIRILEADAIYKEQNIAAKTMLGPWLMEAGRVREAHESLEAVESNPAAGGVPGCRGLVAMSALSNGDYLRAIRLWRDQARETETAAAEAAVMTLPFLALNPYWMAADQYPLVHAGAVVQSQEGVRSEATMLRFQIAMAQLESGDVKGAAQTLKAALDRDPASAIRPLLRFYLFCTTDERIDEQPTVTAPVEEFDSLLADVAESRPANKPATDKPATTKPSTD